MVYFLRILKREDSPNSPRNSRSGETGGNGHTSNNTESASAGIKLILGGYSYGSLVASHLPTIGVIMRLFRDLHKRSVVQEICDTAEGIFSWWKESLQNGMLQDHLDLVSDHHYLSKSAKTSATSSADQEATVSMLVSVPISISYLLISPLLPPVSQFLTMFSPLSMGMGTGSDSPGQRRQVSHPIPMDQLSANRTLVIYGNKDIFTSTKKLRKWSGDHARYPHSKFEHREIEDAGHFWNEEGAEEEVRGILRGWVSD